MRLQQRRVPVSAAATRLLLVLALISSCGASSGHKLPKTRQLNLTAHVEGPTPSSQLARSAPYAIESHQTGPLRNIIFRLSRNQTQLDRGEPAPQQRQEPDEPWTSVSKNGTLAIGSRAHLHNLHKLLEALESNNYTSEVRFDHNDTTLVNITISSPNEPEVGIDAHLLEELLASVNSNDSAWKLFQANASAATGSGAKDNHQRQLQRVRPMQLQTDLSTSPPIRSHIEMAPENYTVRKISEEANGFALKLLNQLNIEKLGSRNLVQAPFAVYQGLALLLVGAQGETAREMDKALLGAHSGYLDNGKLAAHELDRPRLMQSLSEVIRQLHLSATHHLRLAAGANGSLAQDRLTPHMGGTPEQHLIVANNLLFSASAYEIADDFAHHLQAHYNHTAITKIEIGSTESIQVVNSWIRGATAGIIPAIMHKKSTFDEFNVMALLATSWLAQEWRDTFYRVGSPLRTSVRLKGQARAAFGSPGAKTEWSLLEFVDDNRHSHFVDYIRSRPTENIHHFQTNINGMMVDLVSVPFKHSNHRLIALTPLPAPHLPIPNAVNNISQQLNEASSASVSPMTTQPTPSNTSTLPLDLPDASLLTRLIALITGNPRKAMRHLWSVVAPEIITKQTLQTLQTARPRNFTVSEEASLIENQAPPIVQLSIPIVRTEADSSLQAALNHIGIVNAFDPNQANFIGINGHPFNYYKLHLSNVLSKTTFNLNERGINYDKTIKTLEALRIFPNRAPPASGQDREFNEFNSAENRANVAMVDEVKLDKPFMYLICDVRTKLILYTGVVRNPEQEGP